MIIIEINPIKLPIIVKVVASYPLPSKSNLCPGNTDNTVPASGAPRYIEGITFVNVCNTAIEIINIARIIGVVNFNKKMDEVRTNVATKLIWMPGVSPVIVPAIEPKIIAIRICDNILNPNQICVDF